MNKAASINESSYVFTSNLLTMYNRSKNEPRARKKSLKISFTIIFRSVNDNQSYEKIEIFKFT